jgi:hypothetical protein
MENKNELLFEIMIPENGVYKLHKLYLYGNSEGFPENTYIINHATELYDKLIAEIISLKNT